MRTSSMVSHFFDDRAARWTKNHKGHLLVNARTKQTYDYWRYVPCLKACAGQQSQIDQCVCGLPARCSSTTARLDDARRVAAEARRSSAQPAQSSVSRGKIERFHRMLAAEVFALERFRDLAGVLATAGANQLRAPNEALGQEVPSPHPKPERTRRDGLRQRRRQHGRVRDVFRKSAWRYRLCAAAALQGA